MTVQTKALTLPRLATLAAALVLVAGTLSTAPAAAQVREIDRTNGKGGTITGTVTRHGRIVTRDVERTTANGGSFERSTTCRFGRVGACRDSFSGVGAKGRTFSGDRAGVYGPRRGFSAGRFTGPKGNTVRRAGRGWRPVRRPARLR
ncbi:MAG: hypothetical protein AAFS07_12935 [Pseudomonadota bacterium]